MAEHEGTHDADPGRVESEPVGLDPAEAELGEIEEELAEVEVVEVLPVASGPRAVVSSPTLLPAVQTAAAAATGFLVGAAALALLQRRESRRLAREVRSLRDRSDRLARPVERAAAEPGVSYLVHVRVLSRPPSRPGTG